MRMLRSYVTQRGTVRQDQIQEQMMIRRMFIGMGLLTIMSMTMLGCDKQIKEALKPAAEKTHRANV
jgi:hypothetical protein